MGQAGGGVRRRGPEEGSPGGDLPGARRPRQDAGNIPRGVRQPCRPLACQLTTHFEAVCRCRSRELRAQRAPAAGSRPSRRRTRSCAARPPATTPRRGAALLYCYASAQRSTARCLAEGIAQQRRGLLRGLRFSVLGIRGVIIRLPRRFPGEIVPRVLYLGDWADAEAHERLDELNVKRHGGPRSVWETRMCLPWHYPACMRPSRLQNPDPWRLCKVKLQRRSKYPGYCARSRLCKLW